MVIALVAALALVFGHSSAAHAQPGTTPAHNGVGETALTVVEADPTGGEVAATVNPVTPFIQAGRVVAHLNYMNTTRACVYLEALNGIWGWVAIAGQCRDSFGGGFNVSVTCPSTGGIFRTLGIVRSTSGQTISQASGSVFLQC